jgi:hypothetical protein
MPDRIPLPEHLRKIRLLALAFIGACRRLKDAEDRCQASAGAIIDLPGANKGWHAARDLLDCFLSESGGKAPYGWPEAVERTLRKITSMLEWSPDFIFAWPDEIPELEAEIESLAAVATDAGEEGSRIPSPNADRNRFCYERYVANDKLSTIREAVNKRPGWGHLATNDGVCKAVKSHCMTYDLRVPTRKPRGNRRK